MGEMRSENETEWGVRSSEHLLIPWVGEGGAYKPRYGGEYSVISKHNISTKKIKIGLYIIRLKIYYCILVYCMTVKAQRFAIS